jgi:hypothetical protein
MINRMLHIVTKVYVGKPSPAAPCRAEDGDLSDFSPAIERYLNTLRRAIDKVDRRWTQVHGHNDPQPGVRPE